MEYPALQPILRGDWLVVGRQEIYFILMQQLIVQIRHQRTNFPQITVADIFSWTSTYPATYRGACCDYVGRAVEVTVLDLLVSSKLRTGQERGILF